MEFAEMKDRIAHIIRAQNLTAAEFALKLGIQPSSISHLLSGRNNPSLDFVKKLKETFPEYSLDWIIFGQGPMTMSGQFVSPAPMAEHHSLEPRAEMPVDDLDEKPLLGLSEATSATTPIPPSIHRDLKQIVLVYQDNTFEVLAPR